jgi:hypothetical protein
LKTVVALSALATPAAAADAALPKNMLGVWCHDGTKYVRGDCTRENDSWMLLSPRSIEWIESGCRASSIREEPPTGDRLERLCFAAAARVGRSLIPPP